MTELFHVLLVEDDEDDYAITHDLLSESRGRFKLEWIPTYSDALVAMCRRQHDAYLVDYRLGGHNGIELLRQAIAQGVQAPIIILTGLGDEEIDMAALKAGAADYLVKGELTAPLLERSIRYAIERKRTEDEMHRLSLRQAQQVQQIMDTTPDGMLLLDVDRRIVLANSAARHYLRLLTGATVGETLARLGGQTVSEILEAVVEGTTWYELPLPREKQIFEITARPVDVDTEPGGVVMVLRDVSEERQRQEFLQTQERLATVGQLAAGIAHDFNNIMAVITLYSGTLLRRPDHAKRDEYLTSISKQAQHAANLIGQILDFSRASLLERGRLDLLPFVKDVVRLLARTVPENILIRVDAEEAKYPVKADPTRLQQVLMNLAVNARDAMPDGGELCITLSYLELKPERRPPLPEMKPGAWICLAISDSGSGIQPAVLPHIFEPFFTTKERGRGTGLGLAQVYGIIKQHEGEIGVESRPGESTTFNIFLPLLKVETVEVKLTAEQPLPTARGQEVILLVEDDPDTRTAIQDALITLGYQVIEAETGWEATSLFAQHEEIGLVLSDVVMPKMGGLKLHQILQNQRPGTKYLLMSGYPLVEDGKELLELDNINWIQKPFGADRLARKVRQVLDE